ncbi:MAG: mannosyltransferase [Thermoleophilaceae bacterium]|nr:mannosyltransferase [Thermoleophilaceae bacterium]
MPRRRELVPLALITALAAALRLWHIGSQSYWYDESYTVDLVHRGLGDMLSTIPRTESTPPLYYLLAWVWAKAFGTGEAGLRSLSALIGTATVPVAWAAARELFGRAQRVALIAAALVAVNPYFVWYSQEARAYSLLVFTTALSLLFLARALRDPSRRALALWAGSAVLALLTHYFAGFVVVAEAAWLVYATRRREALLACGAVALAGIALMPLALHQRASQTTAFIAQLGLGRRVVDLPKKLVTGELGTFTPAIGPIAGIVAVAAIGYALLRAGRTALGLLWIAAFGAGVPLAFAIAGSDYLLPRNVIAVYVPLVLAVAAGLGLARRPALGLAGAAVICAVAVVVDVEVTRDARLQRTDWRGAAAALGPGPEAIVVTPAWDQKPLGLYARSLEPLPLAGAPVREVVLIGEGQPPTFAEPPAPPGFQVAERRKTAGYLMIRYFSSGPIGVSPATLAASKLGPKPPAFLLRKDSP